MNRLLPTFAPRLPGALLFFTAGYLGMSLTNNLVWPRSVFFALMCCTTLLLILTQRREMRDRMSEVGVPLLCVLLWFLWMTASLRWTIEPRFSVREWETEVQYAAFVFVAYFVVAHDTRSVRILTATLLTAFAILATVALARVAIAGDVDLSPWHHGDGPWSTHLVLVAPVLFALFAKPAGTRTPQLRMLLFVVLLLLLLANARVTDNRMVWLALAASFGTAAIVAAVRWRSAFGRSPWRWMMPLAALFIVLAFALADVAHEKAGKSQNHGIAKTSVAQSLRNDPRIALWEVTVEKIRAAPWLGYGFGRGILRQVLPAELHDPMLTHPHNTFVSQWLQTGAVGLAIFVGFAVALAWRYLRFLRSHDDVLALMGMIGLALLAGFLVKNLTDDFFYRSNAKVFWAMTAILLAYGTLRERQGSGARDQGLGAGG